MRIGIVNDMLLACEALRRVVAKLLEEVKTTNAAAVRYFSVTSLHSLDLAV